MKIEKGNTYECVESNTCFTVGNKYISPCNNHLLNNYGLKIEIYESKFKLVETHQITTEQIKEISNGADVKTMFPDVFKLPENGWLKHERWGIVLKEGNNGTSISGSVTNYKFTSNLWSIPTQQEVEEAFIKYADERYKGKIFVSLGLRNETEYKGLDFCHFESLKRVLSDGFVIYSEGSWVDVVEFKDDDVVFFKDENQFDAWGVDYYKNISPDWELITKTNPFEKKGGDDEIV